MGFFDDFAANIKNAAYVVGEKAGNVYDASKLSCDAAGVKNEIKKKLTEFGKAVYEGMKTEGFEISSLSSEIEELDALYVQLESINNLASEAKNRCGGKANKPAGNNSESDENCDEKSR